MKFVVPIVLSTALLAGVALADDAQLPVLARSFAEAEKPDPPFKEGKFLPKRGETITFLGGTDTFNQQRSGRLEMMLHLKWPRLELRVRNLAWQGDTLFHQARPSHFYTKAGDPQPGSTPDLREKTEPGIVFMEFGKMESLEGEGSLEKFSEAYRELLDQFQKTRTNRIVLIAPTPFYKVGPAAKLADSRNAVLEKFVAEIEKIATERNLIFVDLFNPVETKGGTDWSENGTHLSEQGQSFKADRIASALGFFYHEWVDHKQLKQAIEKKNRLWQQFYHPTNWAFLFGDRQHVPASRDHIDTNKRWFVDEVQGLPKLIAEAEKDIYRYAGVEVAE